jgi:uncharacterized protein
MGRLMALALVCTMMAAVLFQPALMGPPRRAEQVQPPPRKTAVRKQETSIGAVGYANERGS